LGAGGGWMAEFLAISGYRLMSTTLSPHEVATIAKRAATLGNKGLPMNLETKAAPMESIAEHVKDHSPFDAAFVFEALHHAFDWRAAIASTYECLRPEGWLLLCAEPNVLHTAISYRVTVLTNTHEIGFRKSELIQHLKNTGFRRVVSTGKQPHLFFRPLWLMAQK